MTARTSCSPSGLAMKWKTRKSSSPMDVSRTCLGTCLLDMSEDVKEQLAVLRVVDKDVVPELERPA